MRIERLENTPISLKNDGRLSLFFIGVGSAFSKRHFQTNLLVIKGEDHLLIDCGSKMPQALFELGISIMDIKNFFITHSHADHIGGLEEAMLMNRYVKKQKANIIISKEYQSILWNHSLRGGCSFNEHKGNHYLEFEDYWEIIRPEKITGYFRPMWEARSGSLNIKIFRTMHIPESARGWADSFYSVGIIIDDRILFSSDTRFDREMIVEINKAFNIEGIFHDCQFFPGGVHSPLEELKTLPAEIKKKTVLTHYGDNWEDFEAKVTEYGFPGLGKQWYFYSF
ncbi:MAG: MBL fold metallo-hydrolase [Spirochaetales bacterium]|nr:MBL fold metallo-hydrolase [Spirochaetales bacterium]